MDRITVYSILVIGCLVTLFLLKWLVKNEKRVRKISIGIFGVYLCGFLYFTLLSRNISDQVLLALEPLWSYRQALTFDSGFFHVIKRMFLLGMEAGLDSIHVESREILEEIVLNTIIIVFTDMFNIYAAIEQAQ